MPIAKTMEKVISEHLFKHLVSQQVHISLYTCECGDKVFVPVFTNRVDVFARHMAEKLEEEGYGFLPVKEVTEACDMDCAVRCWGCD